MPEASASIGRNPEPTSRAIRYRIYGEVYLLPPVQLEVFGYRFGQFAYITDCSEIPEASIALLKGIDILILDALRYDPHPTHFSIAEAVEKWMRFSTRTHMRITFWAWTTSVLSTSDKKAPSPVMAHLQL